MRVLALVLMSAIVCSAAWREASDAELKSLIPARAQVEKERIETEARTESGITNGQGKFVAGVVLITAGYSADGKYSHFLIAQVGLKVGSVHLSPGEYVFGWHNNGETLAVKFYNARTGEPVGTVDAARTSRVGRIEQFHIYPPSEKSIIQIGRFGMPYQLD